MEERRVEYKDGDVVLEGVLCVDRSMGDISKRPAVIVLHAFAGCTEFEIGRAKEFAKMGYVGFAADIYGKGVRGSSTEENFKLMSAYINDRNGLLAGRLKAAFEAVRNLNDVDKTKIAAIGYCFGGLCALDMARHNFGLVAASSFHGTLRPLPDAECEQRVAPIKARVLVLHGDADIHVPVEQVLSFMDEMRQRSAQWELTIYSGAKHGFAMPGADALERRGVGYNKDADERSWIACCDLLRSAFGDEY